MKTKIVSCHTTDSKPVKQEVKGTVILPPLVLPGSTMEPLLLADLETFYVRNLLVSVKNLVFCPWRTLIA